MIYWGIASLATAYFLAAIISHSGKFEYLDLRHKRIGALDGLRGYLALFVFLHHFAITLQWKSTGIWTKPPSIVFQNMGKVGVSIFFMITGLLFIYRLSTADSICWKRLFSSRIFRIYPLFIFALLLISTIVFSNSAWSINVPKQQLASEYVKWLFLIGGNINNYGHTTLIIAGVHWTLRYEWIFYLLLPAIAFSMKRSKILLTLIFITPFLLLVIDPDIPYINTKFFILFCGGAAVVPLLKNKTLVSIAKSRMFSIISICALATSLLSAKAFSPIQLASSFLFFTIVALGNDLFGLLSQKSSLILGEISYSIYLLHGIVLYLIFTVYPSLQIDMTNQESFLKFMPIITIAVTLFSSLTFLMIESPSMSFGKKLWRTKS